MEKIWIDAVEFDHYGGFVLETQFVREMGQSYLMANGIGEPVAPACTSFRLAEGGTYRLFIRTKNWCPEHNPDGLVAEIDGKRAEHICAEMHVTDWYFEIGGDFALAAGEHTLKIYDTTGWFGRFACVIVTNDYDFMPSRELRMLKRQRAAIKGCGSAVTDLGRYDFIVVGGGVGGIVSAITAARYGLKTALINNRPRLGGNAAEEANVALEGAAHRGFHEMGVVYEIKNYKQSHQGSWSDAFEYYTSKETLLDVFPDMLLIDALTEQDRIREILAIHTHTLTEYKLTADLFADATGDAWLGYYAGADYRIGREAQFQHGESFAPLAADGHTMSGCITAPDPTGEGETVCGYFASESDHEVPFHAPAWAFRLPEGDSLGRSPERIDRGLWWLEMPNDYDDLFESEFVRDSMFRMTAGYLDWLKNSWRERQKASRLVPTLFGTYNAKRETRRLIGDYLLTENDYVEGRTYPDTVGYCGWKIDVHHTGGIFSGAEGKFTVNKKIPVSPIPFGSLYSKNIRNLLMTGRCISTTHIGLGATRVQLTAGILGQAIATAAYLCKRYQTTPRELRSAHMDELQQLLIKDGLYIPGVSHHDNADLARRASVTATSYAQNGEPQNVTNGKVWQNDGADYAWISEGAFPQSITLKFDRPTQIQQVRITLDMPFDEYTYGHRAQPIPKNLITDLVLHLQKDGKWEEVGCISENVQRLVVIDLAPTVVKEIRITATKAVDAERAIIPEIRVY